VLSGDATCENMVMPKKNSGSIVMIFFIILQWFPGVLFIWPNKFKSCDL